MSDSSVIAYTRLQMVEEILTRASNKRPGLYSDESGHPEALGRESGAYRLLDVLNGSSQSAEDIFGVLKHVLNEGNTQWRVEVSAEELTDYARAFDAAEDAFIQEILAIVNSPLPETEEAAAEELLASRLKAVREITNRVSQYVLSEYALDYAEGTDRGAKAVAERVGEVLDGSNGDLRETSAKIHSALRFARSMSREIGYDAGTDLERGISEGYSLMAYELYLTLPED